MAPIHSNELNTLLSETVAKYIEPTAQIAGITELHMENSTTETRRYMLNLRLTESKPKITSLIVKNATLIERLTLTHLYNWGQRVPYCHTLDLMTNAPALLCMQDLGNIQRPTSLDPIAESILHEEAEAIASFHASNWGLSSDLTWLPHTDRAYFTRMIERLYWRPHWERIVRDPAFYSLFASDISRIEAAASNIIDEMTSLYEADEITTLIHTDINPSNVMILDNHPYIIDWHAAHFGPCYLDAPHHFFTPALAELYRAALSAHGIPIPQTEFAHNFRITARYTALRYMYWTFDAWQTDPINEIWVRHYFSMIR